MRVVFVRHGETDYNLKKVIQGQIDTHLNETGLNQAKKVGIILKDEHFDVAYVSDLMRARETAREILAFHPNTTVIFSKEIRERKFGEIEGVSVAKYHESHKGVAFDTFHPKGGGESPLDVQKRAYDFFQKLAEKHKVQNVLLISHGGWLAGLLIKLKGVALTEENARNFKPFNCEVGQIKEDAYGFFRGMSYINIK